ncbi:ABC transporter permease subunit [Actinomadura rudentiformis]|uniref:ABC transporter permease subunit n=1 Tax=Actinomadura rudentiformis TaxID=359158 RepID=A0A6H9Z682_9ACTN|nr:ABC transporter permease subunit [Actinomadura rudentiformis]KAB2349143.1 ABC transporter permease subunit [Actinomadura rudentiformis]
MTTTTTRFQSSVSGVRDDGAFVSTGRLVRAEWTKFRSVRRWILGVLAMAVLTVGMGLFIASGSGTDANTRPEEVTVGPGGARVHDVFQFTHRPLQGDGGITARVTSLKSADGREMAGWAKAGVIIKAGTKPGSTYAAVMVTPGHGVRLQSDFTNDVAGKSRAIPGWLRLVRAGTSVTGYESADGRTWRKVGTVTLPELPQRAEIGLFATSPGVFKVQREFGSTSVGQSTSVVAATFDGVDVQSRQQAASWNNTVVSPSRAGGDEFQGNDFQGTQSAGTFTLRGQGDIAPRPDGDDPVRLPFTGVMIGMIAAIALGVLFITAEYKRGMIRTSFAASPRRGRVLAAKAIVISAVTFATGLVATVILFFASQPVLRSGGFAPPAFPEPSLTEPRIMRAVVGTALFLALVAVFSLGVGTILRRSAGAIAGIITLLVLPTIIASALPISAATWMMRLTPAAGLSIQQTSRHYPQVESVCVPEDGCYYSEPWAGIGVLVAYTAVALGLAYWLLRRRDA